MNASKTASVRAGCSRQYFTQDVEVEIGPEELEEAGWHHEDDCPAAESKVKIGPGEQFPTVLPDVMGAIGSLHRQAHPSQSSDPLACREEPCRSLPFDVLRYAS